MRIKKLNFIIVLGLVATIGILIAQIIWTKQAFNLEENKFSQRAHIALLEVVKKLYLGTNSDLPSENPIKKITNDYYIVNVENDFEPKILEFYLKNEFEKFNISTDFEYAMYNCQSDEMVYGNYVSMGIKKSAKTTVYFPKHKNLVYYFAIRFPNQSSFLLGSMQFWLAMSFVLALILVVYVYSIYTIIQQKKYADMQRDFINNMTHEFKTPLSSILIASNFLKNQPIIKANEKLEKYTSIIINQGKKLNQHVEKVLTMATADDSKFLIHKEKIEIIPVLNDIINTIKLKYPNSKIELKTSKNYFIDADAFHFSNVIYNLIDNAMKYCKVIPEVTISILEKDKTLIIIFSDNGIGIKKESMPFIYDRFFRESQSQSRVSEGFGLGLFYVKKIIDLHKWRITIENKSSGGVSVSLFINII